MSSLTIPRMAFSLAESEAISGLSRSSLYRLIAAGKLKTVVRGRRRLVPAQELQRLVRGPTQKTHSAKEDFLMAMIQAVGDDNGTTTGNHTTTIASTATGSLIQE